MDARPEFRADICVVGGGILGIAHALEARDLGMRVVLLERSERAVGASVRNFGHGCLAAMADGPALECALAARERWLELTPQAGLDLVLDGTLVLARHEDELAVMTEVAADPRRGATVISTAQAAGLAPISTDGVIGALHARLDFRVNPRTAVAQLAALLERDPQSLILWESAVHHVEPGLVCSSRADVRAPLVVLCPGPAFASLPPVLRPQREGLTQCKLQMLRVASPDSRRYRPALMTGLSLVHYPAYVAAPSSAAVRTRLEAERPELLEAGIHLIVTQLPDGDLIVGDSHTYGGTPPPFAEERVFELLLEEAGRLLGTSRLKVRQRWQGVYPAAPGDPFLVQEPLPGVHLVEVVSGIGMTTALGLAKRTLLELSVSPPPAAGPPEPLGAPPLNEATRAGCGS